MTPPVISNSSPLIALAQIEQLQLLEKMFSTIVIPPAVAAEVAPSLPALPHRISVQPLSRPVDPPMSLGVGETEAIVLALDLQPQVLILDDRAARRAAMALNIPIIGTVGLLLACKRRGFIPALRPSLDALIARGFRIAPSLFRNALIDAGESA